MFRITVEFLILFSIRCTEQMKGSVMDFFYPSLTIELGSKIWLIIFYNRKDRLLIVNSFDGICSRSKYNSVISSRAYGQVIL